MKKVLLLAAALGAGVTTVLARQEAQEAGYEPTPEMIAAMSPGDMHAKLDPLVGEWDMDGKARMSADAPWEEFQATAKREWIMDGRFVREEVDSQWMGQPFTGLGLIGYDNVRDEYVNNWIDNHSTGMYYTTGTVDESSDKTKIVFEGTVSDPFSGETDKWTKSVIVFESPDKQVYKSYTKDSSGNEFQNFEIVATRK